MEKQKKLYDQAKIHYQKGQIHNSAFAVYEIQLFYQLYPGNRSRADHDVRFGAYENVLTAWLDTSNDFDGALMRSEIDNKVKKEGVREYQIIFGIPIKMANGVPFPFARTMKINNVSFTIKSWRYVDRVDGGAYREELLDVHRKERYDAHSAERILNTSYTLFEARTWAPRESIAINQVHEAFSLFTAAATVTQERYRTVHYYSSSGIKGRKPIPNPYLLYAKGKPKTGAYIVMGQSLSFPDEALDFTKDKTAISIYKNYLKIMLAAKPTPIEERIRVTILEFDKALESREPHLRGLSFWRCMELATRKSDGATRKQEDILAIVTNFRQDDPWKQRGKLVAAFRNQYVHEGEELYHYTRDFYLIWLQEYASAVLSVLLWMRKHGVGGDAKEIDSFFDLYQMPSQTLRLASRMFNAVKRV